MRLTENTPSPMQFVPRTALTCPVVNTHCQWMVAYIQPELSPKCFIHCTGYQSCTGTPYAQILRKLNPFLDSACTTTLRNPPVLWGRPRAERRTTDKWAQRPLAEVPLNTCTQTDLAKHFARDLTKPTFPIAQISSLRKWHPLKASGYCMYSQV